MDFDKKKGKSKWFLIWVSFAVIVSTVLVLTDNIKTIRPLLTLAASLCLLVSSGIFLILAIKFTAGGHQFARQPVSYAGRLKVFNRPNTLSFLLFFIYNLTVGCLYWTLGLMLRVNETHISFKILGILLYVQGTFITFISLIPIDFFRIFHVWISILGFAVLVSINVLFLLYFIRYFTLQRFPLFSIVLTGLQLGSSCIYALAYFCHWDRTSLIQKIWLVLSNGSLFFYILTFLGFI